LNVRMLKYISGMEQENMFVVLLAVCVLHYMSFVPIECSTGTGQKPQMECQKDNPIENASAPTFS
jgi:hypothetical protein